MSYTQLALLAVPVAILFDLFITRRRMILRRAFWTSYAIILPFQFLTNWWLTSKNIGPMNLKKFKSMKVVFN